MIVDCHSCGATYNISDDKVRGRRVRVRCKTCGEGIIVDGAALDDATRVYSPQFEPAQYSEDKDESTRVMSPSGMEWREPGPDEWTVNLSDTEQRTMSLQDLVSGYNSGTLGEDAYVWRDGMTDWLPLRQVPEISAALDSGESTRVMSQAALRAAAGPPPPSAPTTPGAAAWPPARGAAARAIMAPTPVTYAAPAAPPRAVRTDPPPAASVEYAPSRPSAPPRGAAPARVRENRARADLFGQATDAEAENELLRSSSVPLAQYDEKPTGARNENSVLFSLNTLKAGAPRGGHTSAPPRMLTASPPTAADILGMTAGGAFGGMDGTAALLSAPRVDAPVPPPPTAPAVRDRMDTTPPTMRTRTPLALVAGILVLALAVAGGAFFVLKSRLAPARPSESAAAAPTPPTAAPVAAVASAEPTTPVATSAAAPPEAPVPPSVAPPAPPEPAVVAPPRAPAAPATPSKGAPSQQALKAALRPEKTEPPPAEKGPDKGGKVVLEEEPASAPEEAPKPPFDTGAAKTALAAAAAGAAGCKKPDGPTGAGKVQVTFSPSGRATSANVIEGAFGGTPVGGCIAKAFRAAHVPAFSGDPVTVSKSFTVPE